MDTNTKKMSTVALLVIISNPDTITTKMKHVM